MRTLWKLKHLRVQSDSHRQTCIDGEGIYHFKNSEVTVVCCFDICRDAIGQLPECVYLFHAIYCIYYLLLLCYWICDVCCLANWIFVTACSRDWEKTKWQWEQKASWLSCAIWQCGAGEMFPWFVRSYRFHGFNIPSHFSWEEVLMH